MSKVYSTFSFDTFMFMWCGYQRTIFIEVNRWIVFSIIGKIEFSCLIGVLEISKKLRFDIIGNSNLH